MRRTAGVTHLTVFTRPEACGGSCLFCPRVPDVPHSYLPHSHVVRQGLDYDARTQVRHWLRAVETRGRHTAKLEILVLGGSFTAHPLDYQESFLRGIYLGVDDRSDDASLAQLVEDHAGGTGHRIIGITIECRPDQVETEVVERLFAAGVTKIEMGVQSLDDDVLAFNDRGHDSAAVQRATRIIKTAGLKVGYHLMLGLPGASEESDQRTANLVFEDTAHQPDHLKIYFCEMFRREFMRPRLVALYDEGAWKPLDRSERLARLATLLPRVPEHMRVSRIGRKAAPDEFDDRKIPLNRADAERAFGCRCVRCREPLADRATRAEDVAIHVQRLSDDELFLEARPKGHKNCLGLLRLHQSPVAAIVRELHVYGVESAPGDAGPHQHRGIGRMLMAVAEDVALAQGCARMDVASGPGVRAYYAKLGYTSSETFMMSRSLTTFRSPDSSGSMVGPGAPRIESRPTGGAS